MTSVRKKLYFDINFGTNTAGACRIVPCTQFRASYTGDNYGGVLATEPAIPATVSMGDKTNMAAAKRRNDVSAWFVPGVNVGTGSLGFAVTFVNATTITPGTELAVTGAPAGSTPIYTRNFGVMVRRLGTQTCRGRLYVQRMHSIEV